MIKILGLRIDYDDVMAVEGLSLEIQGGHIYGFVGPNGAGKTSTIKALAGVLEPTCGDIHLAGFDLELHREQALAQVGYMPDFSPVYESLKVWEYLDVFAAAYGFTVGQRSRLIDEWLAKVSLESKRDVLIKGLSRGMLQRLVLAKTLLPEPKILLLDEPASGLDPMARKQVRDLLKEAAAGGAAVMMSSHILSELSEFCDSVGILEKGRMVISGSLEDVRQRIGGARKIILGFADQDQSVERFWGLIAEWQVPHTSVALDKGRYHVALPGDERVGADFLRQLVGRGAVVTHFTTHQDNIEDIFFKVGAKEVA